MPTYQYVCTDCQSDLEAVQTFQEPSLSTCPSCGGKLRKRFGAVGVVFKGSGFYRNDSRSDGRGSSASKPDGEKAPAAETKTETSAKTETKTETKSEPAAKSSPSSGSGSSSSSSSSGTGSKASSAA